MLSTYFAARPDGTLLCLWTRDPDQVRQRLLSFHRAPACGLLRKPDGRHLVIAWADSPLTRIMVRATLQGLGSIIDWPGRLLVEDWEPWHGEPHIVTPADPLAASGPDWLRKLQDAEALLCSP